MQFTSTVHAAQKWEGFPVAIEEKLNEFRELISATAKLSEGVSKL